MALTLALGVPVAAWLLSQRLERRRPPSVNGLGPPAGPADRWLIERHRLPAVQRYQVRRAVLAGRAVNDPALRNAAHGLAAAVLAGQVGLGRGVRLMAWILLAEGALVMAVGSVALADLGIAAGILPVLLGVWWAVKGALVLRAARGATRRALRLNA